MEDSQTDSNIFSVRIMSIDHYMASPIPGFDICYSSFQGGKVNKVPVIRIYGSTPAGQKTCLHVHGALPYFYFPCSDILLNSHQEGGDYTHAISLALEKALKLKGNAGSERQHVHGCSLVRGRKFYGYHSLEELFVKIYLYYPHDVNRAATHLLGGAVLDKVLQPYESHIPFILQFLVDYNLYGMGHVHLSQMKFRHPVPDVFSPRKSYYNGQHRQGMDELTCTTAGFQADSSGGASFSSPVWITSTIPGDWMWHPSSEFDASSDPQIHHVKRQSVCELEGDATVDDILNQQVKIYTSLSQTLSDVKMVQSLIPIWEEEYERTGMHEAAIPLDPGKPLPEDVLKILSFGFEFENRLTELCNEAEDNLTSSQKNVRPVQSVESSNNEENLVALAHLNPDNTGPQTFHCFRERNIIGSLSIQGFPCEEEMDATPSDGKDACPKLFSAKEVRSSEMIESSEVKAADMEALELLKWLASSQAAEDINSDDELVRETIISPLLPATTIDKVLEKANMDYESESQKECQDILDSIEDLIDFGGLKERASQIVIHDHSPQTPSDKKIPQMDGSSDEPHVSPSAGSTEHSLQIDMNSEYKKNSERVLPDTSARITSEHKNNKYLWGSLPFSMTQKMNDDLETVSFNRTDTYLGESKEFASFSARTDLGGCSDAPVKHVDADVCDVNDASTLVGCSVRDMMRRKRCYRVEPPECGSVKVKKVLSESEQKEDIFLCPKHDMNEKRPLGSVDFRLTSQQAEFHETVACRPTYSTYCTLPLSASCDSVSHASTPSSTEEKEVPWPSNPMTKKQDPAVSILCGETYDGKESARVALGEAMYTPKSGSLSCVWSLEFDSNDKSSSDKRLQQIVASGSSCLSASTVPCEMLDMDGCIHSCGQEARTNMEWAHEMSNDKHVDMDVSTGMRTCGGEQVGDTHLSGLGCSLSMSVNMAEETVGLIGMTLSKKPPTLDWNDLASENASYLRTIPFRFSHADEENYEGTSGDCQGEKEVQNKCLKNNKYNSFHEEAVMGVPTHYQNDGSFLYLLTPVFSPPSTDCVSKWLLRDGEGISKVVNAALVEPSSLKASCHSLIASQSPSPDDCDKALIESGYVSHARPIGEQVHQENNVILNAESKASCSEATTVLQNEGTVVKVNANAGGSQDISQISGPDGKSRPTPLSQIGFRDPASVGAGQQLTLLSIEVQPESRGDLLPDPRYDAVNVVALAVQNDHDSIIEVHVLLYGNIGSHKRSLDGISGCMIFVFSEEKHLISHFMKILCSFDPDILMGWDIQSGSLGFLAERAAQLGIGLLNKISRTPSEITIASGLIETSENEILDDILPEPLIADPVQLEEAIVEDEWGRTHASGVHVGGRVVLNVWRLMRAELKLNMYTIEAVSEAVLRRKIPSIPYKVLNKWFSSGPGRARYRCIEYMIQRAKLNLEIMNQLDMINRTSELARVFGIDFFSVLSRGSQYRVESMFLRLAHTQNYLAISPGKIQVASQPAMECLPLVMEPESGFYADPVVVLDFQSLYPSMIIAYNLCFCTCLGKVVPSKENTLGVSSFSPDPHVLRDLKNQIFLTPNGVMYVPSKVRKGVLPRLLEEILSTRIMVKQAMKKLAPSQQVLHRIFNARQLALKLISNVTYGYTAAGFSGRMPCAELADSIVQCGRSTLEKAISFVNAHDRWKAKVVYGDTDSMFVLLKGRTVKESFQIGHEIASAITAMNPYPVTLKMEKVYHPCFLLTKKRYVGYSYESPDQVEPVFDAKGIETVRRDTCGAVAKTMEQSLRFFFEYQDISEVKAYLHRQWKRILSGRVSLQDFVFAKEVRLGTYSTRASSLPPAAIVATKAMRADPRAEPRYGERVPYVVIHGEPGARLVDMVVDPLDLLTIDSPYRLNDLYYINKQIIPALQRVFGLVGADLNQWFSEMPRSVREAFAKRPLSAPNPHRTRIDYYYLSRHCILCGELVQASAHLCNKCLQKESAAATVVIGRTSKLEREMQHLAAICRHCGGADWLVESGVKCTSLACSVFYERRKVQKELQGLSAVAADKGFYPKCMAEWF